MHLSARILPFDASTSSSTFGMNASISFGRGAARTSSGSPPPASRNATYRRTVFASHPASCAAECGHLVRSYDSKISMISLADLVTVSGPVGCKVSNQQPTGRRDPLSGGGDGDHLTAQQEFRCPRAGTQLSVKKDFSVSASTVRGAATRSRPGRHPRSNSVPGPHTRCTLAAALGAS
jgi:hypothetical protein